MCAAIPTPAELRKPTDIPRDLGGLDDGSLVGYLATVGAIAGAIWAIAATGDGGAFVPGAIGGAIVGSVIGLILSDFLWRIGLHVEEADCSGCGRELEPTLFVCPGCATPVKYQWGKAPVELTPSDRVLLDMVPRKTKEENGRCWVEVEVPSGSTNQPNRVLATALLANEEAGAIRLEMAEGNLVAVATGNNCQAPGDCLEAELCKAGLVYNTVFDWIGTSSYAPEADAVKRIMGSMAKRMLLEPDRKRVLNLFTMVSSRYLVPKRTSNRLMERSGRLIEEGQRARPDMHDHLTKDIARAFDARTEEPPSD